MLKKIGLFIGLKVVEIGGVVFGPYALGRWNPFSLREMDGVFWLWFRGLGTLTLVAGVLVGVGLLCYLCYGNWNLVKRIIK